MTRTRSCSLVWCALVASPLPLGALAHPVRLGGEFQVNTYTSDDPQSKNQGGPAVASDADGDFVVAWQSRMQDGDGNGIFARRFSSAGSALATEIQINSYTTEGQSLPAVALDADGDFVIAWQSLQEPGSYGIFLRRFTNTGGALLSGDLHVNTYTVDGQGRPAVANESNGDFVVIWESFGQDGSFNGVFGQLFTSSGSALDGNFQVNTHTEQDQRRGSVAMDADGDFIVVWQSYRDGSNNGVFAQRFSSSGTTVASEFQVNVYTTNGQGEPAVATASDGSFVVAWGSTGQDGSQQGVFVRLFSSAGAALTGEIQVNTYTPNHQRAAHVMAEADGDFVVTWESLGQDGSEEGIFARRFSSSGAPVTAEFQVSSFTPAYQLSPSVGVDADGHFVVVWESYMQDDGGTGIFAQRFAGALTLDVDGDGPAEPLTDGLLALRFLFGFTGPTLTSGAVSPMCSRCDASTIEPYLTDLGLALDVDDNGEKEPLMDGLLVLRYLFGFRGATLTTGAVGDGCMRCDAAEIEPYLLGLVS